MSEAGQPGPASVDAIVFEFRWTRERLTARDTYFSLNDILSRNIPVEIVTGVVCGLFLGLVGGVYMFEWAGRLDKHATAAFAAGGVILFALLAAGGRLQTWLQRRQSRKRHPFTEWLLDAPAETVTLARDGVRIVGPGSSMQFEWSAFERIGECMLGVVLALSPGHGLLVPDDALPAGIDRAEVLRKVKRWKGPW